MKWKIVFGTLFIMSVAMTFVYGAKSLVIYNRTMVENVPAPSGTSVFEERVTRTYHDNYASIGGAIAFGVIAAASLLAFAITIRNERS